MRGVFLPIGDASVVCSIAGISVFRQAVWVASFQRMHQTAFRQFHFESILALWSGVAQSGFGRFSKNSFGRGLIGQCRFRFGRSPGLRAHAAKRNPCARDFSARDRDNDRRGGEREFIRSAIAQFQIK